MVILGVDNLNTKYHQEIPCKGYSWIILRETRLEKDDGNAVCPNVNEYEDGDLSYLEWRRRWLSVELLTRRVCLLVCLSAYQAAHSSPQRQLAACSCHSSDRDPVQVFLLKELWKHNTTTYVPCLKCDLWEPYNLTRKGEFLIKCKQNKLETQDLTAGSGEGNKPHDRREDSKWQADHQEVSTSLWWLLLWLQLRGWSWWKWLYVFNINYCKCRPHILKSGSLSLKRNRKNVVGKIPVTVAKILRWF